MVFLNFHTGKRKTTQGGDGVSVSLSTGCTRGSSTADTVLRSLTPCQGVRYQTLTHQAVEISDQQLLRDEQ